MTGETALSQGDSFPDLDALSELARTQPKITVDDPRVVTRVEHDQFGNNFFRRFVELEKSFYDEALTPPSDESKIMQGLYQRCPELCTELFILIAAKQPYDKLREAYIDYTVLERSEKVPVGSAQALNEAVDHPRGIEAIGMYYWDAINPLLSAAYSELAASGIDPLELTK